MNHLSTRPSRWRPITVLNLLVGLLLNLTAIGQYQIIQGEFTWQEANLDARSRGGYLATITSDTEWQVIEQFVSSSAYKNLWLGGFQQSVSNEPSGGWTWVTGEPWEFSVWTTGEPNNYGGGENYLMLRLDTGGWNDINIDGSIFGRLPYLLEIAKAATAPRIATATAQVVNGFVVGSTIVDAGYGYVENPVVAIIGGGGTGAKATATQFNGVVTSITITNPGSGYTGTPTITIAPPPFPPKKATATSQVVNGFVVGTKITDGGFGYESPPAVLFIGGGGNGATAVATVANGIVTAITITNPGSGYTSEPIVRFGSPTFAPKLSIETSKVYVRMSVVLGRKYQLEASTDLNTWTTTGPAFIAQDEELAQEFDVNQVGRYFRINQVP